MPYLPDKNDVLFLSPICAIGKVFLGYKGTYNLSTSSKPFFSNLTVGYKVHLPGGQRNGNSTYS